VKVSGSTATIEMQQLPEVGDNPKDTPKDVGAERRLPLRMIFALATTPILTGPTVQLDAYAPSSDRTAVLGESVLDELSLDLISVSSQQSEHGRESEVEAENWTRLELLAREFVDGQLSTEEQARLAIVSERVRRLIPSVTAEDFEALETMIEDVRRIEAEDIERRRRLGIE
jgi:hypothetical protein